MVYSDEQLAELRGACDALAGKYQTLLFALFGRTYVSARGNEFAMQGFLRRLDTLRTCIYRLFEALPPEVGGIPENNALQDATIALQAFVLNVFGCMDNLAWVWVEEKPVRKADGNPIPPGWVGLGAKYTTLRASFSDEFRAYLDSRQGWFAQLENYRHALAHRIPLYIPPHCVEPANRANYLALEQQISRAVLAQNLGEEARLRAEQRELMFFKPVMMHSYVEHANPVFIHYQMFADFHTIEEMAQQMLAELAR